MNLHDDQIRQRAYEIWEHEGRPAGKQDEHWQRACEEIERELSAKGAGANPRASRKASSTAPIEASPAAGRKRKTSSSQVNAGSATPAKARKPRGTSMETAALATQSGSSVVSTAGEIDAIAADPAQGMEAPQSAPSKPKYRHPENLDLTWSGRGRRPAWIRDALEAGRRLTDFEVGS